nr:signal peptidase I [Klugiella xanthotipulae]
MNTSSSASPASPRRRGTLTFIRDVIIILVLALIASFLVKTFLVRSFYIPSSSMEDTLQINDRILVNQLVPEVSAVHHGDVVVFTDPGGWLTPRAQEDPGPIQWFFEVIGLSPSDSDNHLVKRVIGLPGDNVMCCNTLGQLVINGEAIKEPYVKLPANTTKVSSIDFDIIVPKDSLWVMGDNRYSSQDSRYHMDQPGGGSIPMDNVVGHAFIITWPLNRLTILDSHSGIFPTSDSGSDSE